MSLGVVGRSTELAAIDEFLVGVAGGGAALVLEGEPGIGKTTLWQAAADRARRRGMTVLASRAGPSEARLTFVGLADLLGPVEEVVLRELPAPQRRALDVALLREDPAGPSPDRRSVSAALLSVLRALSDSGPVVVAVDDVQWLDLPTWRVLEFALRRLPDRRVGFLATRRLTVGDRPAEALERALREQGHRRVRLGPLSVAALHEILKAELGQTFTRPVLVRIERASAGNPFFALELARAIVEHDAPGAGPAPLPVPDTLRELIERRLRRLPAGSRRALLVASALSQPTLELLDRSAIERAEEAGVVRIGERGRVEFAHPLLAAAVYDSASTRERRAVHAGLAERVHDREERARHLALAAEGPDADVAAALEQAARSARSRGSVDAAIELFDLACRFTPPGRSEEALTRRFELARALAAGGDPQRAADVLRDLIARSGAGPLRARARVILAFNLGWEGTDEAVGLCELALDDAGGDRSLSAEIHAVTSRICDTDTERKTAHARAALDLAGDGTVGPSVHAYALLAVAEADFNAGRGISRPLFERAAALETAAAAEPAAPEHLLGALHGHSGLQLSARLLATLQLAADELDAARELFREELRLASDEGDEVQAARTLPRLAALELRAGRWDVAECNLLELERLVERTGQEGVGCQGLAVAARLDALRGREDAARSAGEQALALAVEGRHEWLTVECLATLGFVELSAGELERARGHLDGADETARRFGVREPGLFRHHADHVESLVALGELAAAGAALERLEEQGRTAGRPWALATGARCRALLLAARGDLDGSLAALELALAAHAGLPVPFELARTLLVKGRLHRRRNERLLAKEALLQSIRILDGLGSPPWAQQAQSELRRLGLRRGARDELTPTEERIAALAASGLTNRKIAERAFLSPKTVEANLARVYRKLGIRSRAELGARMAEREPTKKL